MLKPSIQFVKREDGVKIAYTEFGKGEVLVFPAPWVTSLSYIIEDPFANRFWERLAQEATVVLYDKHGCGQSDRDRTDFSLQAELLDLETVIDHLGLDQFNLFGSSMAGPVSLAYTDHHPKKVTHLILYGAYASGKNLAKKEVKSALISLIRASWGLGSKALADIFLPGANREQLQSLAKFQRESSSPDVAAKLLELSYSIDITGLLPDIKVPTLILHRNGDKVIPTNQGRQLAIEIPNARFKVLEGNIHIPWYGESDDIIKEIHEFISGEEPLASESIESEASIQKDLKIDKLTFPIEVSEFGEQVTIVFSDIVSSTDLVARLGDATARDIFLQHDKIVRDQIKKHGGRELQNLGDGFMLSFESASASIKCACDIQREITINLVSIKVRIGINTGEVVRREGRHPFGQAVVVASRIVSRAKGEQILVSDVTKHLTAGSGFSFVERGRFKPKGFSESMKLYEVSWKE